MWQSEFDEELFLGKHRIKTTRLPNWDYSSNGYYFVTIYTKEKEDFFGEIQNGIMGLNEIGLMVYKCWKLIPKHFKHVLLDEWVVMPNHIHGIIQIFNDPPVGMGNRGGNKTEPHPCRDAINRVSTVGVGNGGITGCHNPMGKNTLGEIIRWFKGRTSFEIHKNIDAYFQWQPKFYDHIIRNEKSLYEIRKYIYYNPQMWERDRNNLIYYFE